MTLLWLLKLKNRVNDKSKPLSEADRQAIAILLQKISSGEDVRELFFPKGETGRPSIKDERLALAVDFAINWATGSKYHEALAQTMKKSRRSEDQVKAALRYHHKAAKAYIEGLSPERLQRERRTNDARIVRCKNSK